jgi:hypothetical protein
MNTIYKYPLTDDVQSFDIPKDAEILCLQVQNDVPCIWALVDTDKPKVKRHFEIRGTGDSVPPFRVSYIGTYQLNGGRLVFHVFET